MPLFGDPKEKVEEAKERGDVQTLVRFLSHHDRDVREKAAEALRDLAFEKPDSVVPYVEQIARALSDSNKYVREKAAWALEDLPKEATVPILALITAGVSRLAKEEAIKLLEEWGYGTSPRSLGRICEEKGKSLLEAGDLEKARKYLEAAKEHYIAAKDSESAKRISSLLGEVSSPKEIASKILSADSLHTLALTMKSVDLILSSAPEEKKAEIRAALRQSMSKKLAKLQEEEKELKLAFLEGHLTEQEYEKASSRIREMQELIRRKLGTAEETPKSIRKKLSILNELYLDGAISKEEYERKKRVLESKLKVLTESGG